MEDTFTYMKTIQVLAALTVTVVSHYETASIVIIRNQSRFA